MNTISLRGGGRGTLTLVRLHVDLLNIVSPSPKAGYQICL